MEISLSAECQPLMTIADCVNLSSGHFFKSEHDLIGNTIDPLCLTRIYDSGSVGESFLGFAFGSQFSLFASDIQKSSRHSYAMICERDGFFIPYRGKSKHHIHQCQIDPRLLKKGYTNLNRAEQSGHSNFVNWHATFKQNAGEFWVVHLGNGTKRIYGKKEKLSSKSRIRIGCPTHTVYLLTEEIKPNGNKIRFDYCTQKDKPLLSKVQTLNRSGKIINELQFGYQPNQCTVTSSCGSKAVYAQSDISFYFPGKNIERTILQRVYSSQKGPLGYHYAPNAEILDHHLITKIKALNTGQFLEVIYNREHKVKSLKQPVGQQKEAITTYQFNYGKDFTEVKDAHQNLSIYHFDKNRRLSSIDHFDQNQIIRKDVFEWSSLNGQEGWLKSKSIQQGNQIFHLTNYQYDAKGNVIRKTIFGNLTGEKPDLFSKLEDVDQYSIEYSYSQDERNLLLGKKTPEGVQIFYSYLPGTNLCTKELHHYNGKIQERIFRFYDENGQLQGLIEDDGSGQEHNDLSDVTYCREKFIYTVQMPSAAFGKPKQLFEKYLDRSSGCMVERKRTDFSYDSRGNEIKQKVYDSKGHFLYTLTKKYDKKLRLTRETDALGYVTHYEYDDSNNKTREEKIGSGTFTRFFYDRANRLVKKEEHHQSGEVFSTRYSYNFLNQMISETNSYGQKTTYEYDRFGNETKCVKPLMQLATKELCHPTITKTYNALSQMTSRTDENGYTTYYAYTVRGDPTEIIYPDGSHERFRYNTSGWLIQKWQKDNTSIAYSYDPTGRLIQKSFLDEKGAHLKQEEYRYKGDLLIFKKDAMGITTFYEYDGAGRKIKETTADETILYAYDDLERLIKISQGDRCEVFEYDYANQLLSKILQDSFGHIYARTNYAYDINGNCIQKAMQQSEEKVATYTYEFDSKNRLTWREDPLGNRTNWTYHNHHVDSIGQKVLQRSMTDALGRIIHEDEDAYHRIVKKALYEGNKQRSLTEIYYDPAGKKVKQTTDVMCDEHKMREYNVQWEYNSLGLLSAEIEQGKITRFVYDIKGLLIQKVKPDGLTLHYEYDPLNRLTRIRSSDDTIDYTYQYDLHNNPIEIHDHICNIRQSRHYDALNRLLEEEISPGNRLLYQYDSLGRLIQMTLPDGSLVTYEYDPFHLRKVKRPHYGCECAEYDMQGHLLKSISPAGTITYTYDLLGRNTAIQTHNWESHLEKFDSVGNLLTKKDRDPDGETNSQYYYDCFNHLLSENSSQYHYDSLGNCLRKNHQSFQLNDHNQIVHDGESTYKYDINGNLTSQTPSTTYTYDALDRLIFCEKEGEKTSFIYDAFNRCIQMTDANGTKQFFYQGDREIGSIVNGKIQEFRLLHPNAKSELTFSIEYKNEVYFPIQDYRHNVCALRHQNGNMLEWHRYSAFGSQKKANSLSPWTFVNRRQIAGLFLFTHRFYNPELMRWQSPDPLRFEDGMNLYTYTHNNPFLYWDQNGQFAWIFALPAVLTFGLEGISFALTVQQIAMAATIAATFAGTYYGSEWVNNKLHQMHLEKLEEGDLQQQIEEKEKEKKKEVFPENLNDSGATSKKHTPDQEAIGELVKESGKKGVSNADADTLLEWAKEYNFPHRDDRGKPHWHAKDGMDHIHLGTKHIPVTD